MVPMARWPTYHLHICEFVGDQGTPRFPHKLFASPQTTLATPGAPPSEHPADLDQRLGPIEVHFVRVRRRAPRHPMENLGNETYGRFQEVDTFEVEPARDEWSDSEVQHDVRVAFGIVHLFRLLEDDFDDDSVSGKTAEPPEETDEDPIGTILGMVSVPSSITVSSLLDFVEPALEAIQHMRIVRYVVL